MKKLLQDVTNYKVMSAKECIKALGWSFEEDDKTITVTCNCSDSKIVYRGFMGTEVVECESCGKRIVDLFSPIPVTSGSVEILDYKYFEVEKDDEGIDRFWIAIDGDRGIFV